MATIDSHRRELSRSYWIAGLFGVYACAIAAAPRPWGTIALAAPAALAALACWILHNSIRWFWCFCFAALLLPPLPIALGNSGPHVALVFAALGLAVGVLHLQNWRIKRTVLTFALTAFFLMLLCSSAVAVFYSGFAVAAGSFARVLLFGIALYVFFYFAHGPGWSLGEDKLSGVRRLYGFGVLSAIFACVDFYYQFPAPAGFGPQFIWVDSGVYRRAQGVFYEASTLGNLCAFFLIMIAVMMMRRPSERPLSRVAAYTGGAFLFAALILSYSRGSLLNLCVALLTLLCMEHARIRFRQLVLIVSVCVATGAAAAWLFFPDVTWSYWLRLLHTQFFFSQPESVLSGRLSNWRTIFGFLAAHPWHAILGIGYKTLPYSNFIGPTVIADNMYLSLLIETGIAGLAAFLLLNFALVRASWLASRRDDRRASFFGTWFFCFWIGQLFQMLSGDLFTYWRVLPLYFWVLAMAIR